MFQLRDLATEPGSTGISRLELDERRQIEAVRDDGTEYFYRRAVGPRSAYQETGIGPIDNQSMAVLLGHFGLSNRDLSQLDRHGCATIADVRQALREHRIPTWRGCGVVMEGNVRRAVAKIGKARTKKGEI